MVCSSCGLTSNYYCSENLCSSCCLNTYHNDCSNSCFTAMCPSGVAWAIDVAQFSTPTECCDDYLGHTINIHNRAFLTLTQFQQMFYSDHKNLSTANPPQCDNSFCLIASPWVCPSGNTHIADSTNVTGNNAYYYSGELPATVFGPSSSSILIPTGDGVQWCPNRTDHNQSGNTPHWVHIYQIPTAEADYVGWGGRYGWVPTNLLTLDSKRSYYNYNCLGGKDNPPYFFLGYLNDVSNNGIYEPFQAQKTIMDNMVKDLDASLNCWDLCTRASIYDQLFNLCFANEHSLNNCLELKCGRSWKEVIDAFPPTQTFNLQYSTAGVVNTILFSHVPNNGRTAAEIFAGNGIVGPEAQGVWISRIQHATEDYPNASRNFSGPWWSPWTYEQYPPTQNSVINEPWDIQPNTPYRITLIATTNNVNSATPVTWNYNVVNVGDFVSMNVNAKIHNNHCKVNTNTIKINYICKVDQELSDYCGTPISSNRGFKQDQQGTFYDNVDTSVPDDESTFFNNVFLHSDPLQPSVTVGGGDDGALPAGAFDDCGIPPDCSPPTVTITLGASELVPNNGASITIIFSEQVIGFNPINDPDVTITGPGTLAPANAWGTTTTPGDYGYRRVWNGSFSIPQNATAGQTGTITVGTFWTDLAGLPPTSGASATYTVVSNNTNAPTATLTLSNNSPPAGGTATLTIVFSETAQNFDINDLTPSGSNSLNNFTQISPGLIYTVTLNTSATAGAGSITLGVVWQNLAGVPPASSTIVNFTVT